jgi:hypothetical protein
MIPTCCPNSRIVFSLWVDTHNIVKEVSQVLLPGTDEEDVEGIVRPGFHPVQRLYLLDESRVRGGQGAQRWLLLATRAHPPGIFHLRETEASFLVKGN